MRRRREATPRDTAPLPARALPPREPLNGPFQLITAERACARSRWQPGTRRRSLPRSRGRWSPPMRLLRKDYSSHHATRGRAPLTPLGAEDEAHLAGRVACWASLFSTLIQRRCTGGVRCQGSGGIPSPRRFAPVLRENSLETAPLDGESECLSSLRSLTGLRVLPQFLEVPAHPATPSELV